MSRKDTKVKALVEWVRSDAAHEEIAKALPGLIVGEENRLGWVQRLERTFVTALEKNPKLKECSKHSIATCVLELAEFGLMPNGRDAHLIPRNIKQPDGNWRLECTLIVDYKGFVTILHDYCGAEIVDGAVVYDGDEFDYQRGGNEDGSDRLVHRPTFPRTSKTPIAVYTRVKFKGHPIQIHAMDIEEVESKRRRSKDFNGKFNPNQTDPDDMRKRTCLKNMMKWLPRTDEFTRLIDLDNGHNPIEPDEEQLALSSEIPVEETKVEVLENGGELVERIEGMLADSQFTDPDLDEILRAHKLLKPDQSWRSLAGPTLSSIIDRFDELTAVTW
jgi:recombination protein RecT